MTSSILTPFFFFRSNSTGWCRTYKLLEPNTTLQKQRPTIEKLADLSIMRCHYTKTKTKTRLIKFPNEPMRTENERQNAYEHRQWQQDTDHSHDALNQHTALLVYHKQNPFLSTRLCFLVLNVDYNATLNFNSLFSVKLLTVTSFFQCRWFLSRAIFSLMFDPQLVEGKIPEGCPIHPHRNGPYKPCVNPYGSNGSTTGVYVL